MINYKKKFKLVREINSPFKKNNNTTTRYSLIITGHLTCVLLYFKLPVTEFDMRIDSLRQEVPKHFPIFSFGTQKPSTKGCPLFLPVGHVISICKSFSLLQVHRYFRPVPLRSSSRKQFSQKSKYPCKEKKTSSCKKAKSSLSLRMRTVTT